MIGAMLVVSGRMYGGGQRVVLDLLEESEIRSGPPLALCLLGGPVPDFPPVRAEVVAYDGRYDRFRSVRSAAREFRSILARTGVDLVHSHGWDSALVATLALRGSGVAHLIHIHTSDPWLVSGKFRHGVRRWITRWMAGRPRTALIAVSEAVRGHWAGNLGFEEESIHVVRNGVDTGRFHPRPAPAGAPGTPVIGTAARLQGNKGWEDLLEALEILGTRGFRPGLRVAGEGPYRVELESEIRRRGLDRQVELPGFIADVAGFCRELDVGVLASHTEGFPLFVIEAMASGLPVVATDVGGTREALRDGEDGLLVPPRNPGALAGALQRLLSDGEERRRMGASGRSRAMEEFSRRRFYDRVAALHREVLGSEPRPLPSATRSPGPGAA